MRGLLHSGIRSGIRTHARAVILAAGRGERLRPFTDRHPKCLVRIGGRALLEWQLDALRTCGITDVAVVTGYRGSVIEPYPVTCLENGEWSRSNMVVSLLRARRWLRAGTCVVAYGDIAYHPQAIATLLRSAGSIAITYDVYWRALWEERFARPQDDAESLRVCGGRVTDIGGAVRDLDAVDGQFMGLLKLEPDGWHGLECLLASLDVGALARLQTTQLLQRAVATGMRVDALPVEGRWCELDTGRDLELYEARLRSGLPWTHDWRPADGRRS